MIVVVIVLHPEQEAEVNLIAADLDVPVGEVVRALLSGPLSRHVGERVG